MRGDVDVWWLYEWRSNQRRNAKGMARRIAQPQGGESASENSRHDWHREKSMRIANEGPSQIKSSSL